MRRTTLIISFWLSLVPAVASASIGFQRITSNNAENVASQLAAEVRDQAMASSDFGINILANEVLFTFTNSVGIPSSISEIYFDDGTLLAQSSIINSIGGSTSFTGPGANPSDLPSGNNVSPPFSATVGFSADAVGNPSLGVDTSSDIVGLVFQLQAGKSFADVLSSISDGSLRIGLHVRAIGEAGGSDSFVNTGGPSGGIPEPSSLFVWGLLGTVVFSTRWLRR